MDPTGEFVVVANTVTAGNTDNWGIYTLSLRADQVLYLTVLNRFTVLYYSRA